MPVVIAENTLQWTVAKSAMRVATNTGQWGARCLGSNCLPCCLSRRSVEPQPPGLGAEGVSNREHPQSKLGVRRTPAPRLIALQEKPTWQAARGPSWGTSPTWYPAGHSCCPCGGRFRVKEQALLRTCVPPAATQDTRGRSSARVPCCSPRSHTESSEPGLGRLPRF